MYKIKSCIVVLTTFVVLLILTGCLFEKNDGSGMPCPTSKREELLGNVTIDSTFRIWIRPNTFKRTFVNSNGGVFALSVEETLGGWYNEQLEYIWVTEPCQDDRVLVSRVEYDNITYSSPDLPFDIQIRRLLSLDYNEFLKYQDTLSNKSEQIEFYVGGEETRFYISDTNNSYFEGYELLDSTYNQVYVCAGNVVKQGLYPTKFVLQKGKGLVGFELSNKEVWAIK